VKPQFFENERTAIPQSRGRLRFYLGFGHVNTITERGVKWS